MTAPEPAATFTRKEPRRRFLRLLIVPVLLLAVGFAVLRVGFKAYKLPAPSMQPTLEVGDRILMKKGGYDPEVGDIVILHAPASVDDFSDPAEGCKGGKPARRRACEVPDDGPRAEAAYVQRIVAGPGDLLKLRDGRVTVNGVPERVTGLPACQNDCTFQGFEVPAGHWFTLGDNRGNSSDGRYWGPLNRAAIDGPVVARYWPLERLGGV
ncbi:MAG: signal peptidase I [Solirubrobacteraceae bacterium]|nr:signal peptidase I [Solirubrobacteraceae bacterium]